VRILIADDDPVITELLIELVTSFGHDCTAVNDGVSAWERVLSEGADVIISDWMMPGLTGLQLCERVRAHAEIAYPYFIVLTARGEHDDVLTALRAGADDHLAKPLDLDELQARLIVAERVRALHLKMRDTQAALELTAHRDALTGLGNRLSLNEDLLSIHGRFVREAHAYSIVLLDIDYFKNYNDSYGHQRGDAALTQVGRIIASEIREGDAAYRYGGEEFLLVLPNRSLEEAAQGAERIRASVAEAAAVSGLLAPVTLSGGVAGVLPGESIENAIGRADNALYLAKNAGRNQLVIETRTSVVEAPSWRRGAA
jgi:diguanylate cyclase (GGDEF)-like protein